MELTAETRTIFGKQTKTLRKKGLIPAELYGHGVKNEHLSIPTKAFLKVFKEAGMNTMVTLEVDKAKHPVIIHDVDRDYVTNEIRHVDLYQVSLKEEMKARIPLEFEGESPAVKEQGGILNKAMSEIEVQALPDHLPHRLHVDLSTLVELHGSVYVKDLVVPKGVKVLIDPETVIATVTPPKQEEEVVAPATLDVSAVKVEDEEKKAERAKDKEE